MDWIKVIKAGAEIVETIGDLLDDGKVDGSNKNKNKKD